MKASGPKEAFRYLDGERWVSLTWNELQTTTFELAAGLLSLGVETEDRVAIASGTRIEWVLADLAIMCAGGATTTVYPTTQHEDVSFILADSGSKIVFAEDELQVAKVLDHLPELPELVKIIQISGAVDHALVIGWDDFGTLGREHLAAQPGLRRRGHRRHRSGQPGHLDLHLGHHRPAQGGPAGARQLDLRGHGDRDLRHHRPDDLQYLWLPLSHVFGKALIAIQLKIGFATAIDGRIDKIVDNLGVVQPTFMAGAPRIFEKVRARVMMGASHGVKGKIFNWAFDVGHKTVPMRLAGRQPSGLLGVQYALADRLVFSKIKARMGGKIRFFVSGSAALSREVQEWFYAAGLLVLEGYGLTETSAATCVNNPRATRFGTVGPAGAGHRDQDRRRRRDPGQGSRRDARLPQPRRGQRRDRSPTAGSPPVTSASSTTATCGSPTARRT